MNIAYPTPYYRIPVGVFPFDKHPEGNKALQAKRLDAKAWQSWLARVVATEDQRLGGTVDRQKQQAYIEDTSVSLKAMAEKNNQPFDLLAMRDILEKEMARQAQEYQKAVVELKPFCRESIPPDIWTDEPSVGELLLNLWKDYRAVWQKERMLGVRSGSYFSNFDYFAHLPS